MSKIKLLPENLINQIAAGEVVERPASVVKELVENSIDAGATRIIVEVSEGGESFIRITDDGEGMDKEDAIMAFERHATSKIANNEDLFNIRTLGFRGEAIASIASVSLMTLTTKKRGSNEGNAIENTGGVVSDIKTIGCPEGTKIEVRNLFYNTPARKKYLKNSVTEFGHIVDTLTGIALAHYEVAFKFFHDGKVVFDLPSTKDAIVRIGALLGRNVADELIPVFYGGTNIKLSGFIGKPILNRASKGSQYLFVNSREVKSHVLSFAVKQSYHSLIPKDKHPVFLLFFEIDPAVVDVNVHPRKLEVRFSNDKEIFKIVLFAAEKALETFVLTPKINTDSPQNYYTDRVHKSLQEEQNSLLAEKEDLVKTGVQNYGQQNFEVIVSKKDLMSGDLGESVSEPVLRKSENEIHVLAQLSDSYILCQQDKDLVLIDQHAAHERIRYTQLLSEFENKDKNIQKLLLPLNFDLSIGDVEILKENIEIFNNAGFEIEEGIHLAFMLCLHC